MQFDFLVLETFLGFGKMLVIAMVGVLVTINILRTTDPRLYRLRRYDYETNRRKRRNRFLNPFKPF